MNHRSSASRRIHCRSASLHVLIAAATLSIAPISVRADDWLAVWPACSIVDGSRPSLSLLYPAPGLPAVVHAGEALIARLRTPSALTPPPGVQQERVLERWTAELSGAALHVGVDPKERHRHLLPVISIRPDGGDSLVYRVRVEIPAYVAPGSYAFALRSPFGTRSAPHAVRVLAAGATPRVARLPAGMLAPPPNAGTWPADVWLAGETAEEAAREGEAPNGAGSGAVEELPAIAAAIGEVVPAEAAIELVEGMGDPAPTLLGEGSSVALRVGRELWVRRGCNDDGAFEREVTALVTTERLARVAFDERRASQPPTAAELSAKARLSFEVDHVTIDNGASPAAREISLLLPFASRVAVDAGTFALYPASEPNARTPVSKLGLWIIPPGRRAGLRIGRAREDGQKPLALHPTSARSGQPAQVRILGADAQAKVAFALGSSRSAYASPSLRTSFAGPLVHPIRAQVFETDGAGQVVHGHLWVEPHRPPNCAIARGGSKPARFPAAIALFALALLVRGRRFAKKARPGTGWNRLPPEPR